MTRHEALGRHGYADLSDTRLHYVEAGEGPLVVLLHGFPELWYAWRAQIPALAAAGFRVVAPDLRGYNLSERPRPVDAYRLERVAGDVRDLIAERGAPSASLAGHDWGGAVAWLTAMHHPAVVDRLAVLNWPHPRRLLHGMADPRQLARVWYAMLFQLPRLAESSIRARNWWLLRRYGFERDARPGSFTAKDLDMYVEAWSRPGAATAMLSYYRAAARQTPRSALAQLRPVTTPTLVIWGERDRYFRHQLADPSPPDVPGLERVVRLPDSSHWVQHDEAERVSALLAEFFAAPAAGAT